MDNDDQNTDTQLRVTVEVADDFELGDRTAAALQELVAALDDEHGEETAGFAWTPELLTARSFTYRVAPKSSSFEMWPSKWKASGFDGKGNDTMGG